MSSSKPPIKTVSEHVARNPIARAFAMKQLNAHVTDQVSKLYSYDDGVECLEFILGLADHLAVAVHIYHIDQMDQRENYPAALDLISKGLEALKQLSESNFVWQKKYAVCLDLAVEAAVAFCEKGSPDAIRRALILVYHPDKKVLPAKRKKAKR